MPDKRNDISHIARQANEELEEKAVEFLLRFIQDKPSSYRQDIADVVLDLKRQEADEINGQGPRAQLQYIAEQYLDLLNTEESTKEIADLLDQQCGRANQ